MAVWRKPSPSHDPRRDGEVDGERSALAVYAVERHRPSFLQFVGAGDRPSVSEEALLAGTLRQMSSRRTPAFRTTPGEPSGSNWARVFRQRGFSGGTDSTGTRQHSHSIHCQGGPVGAISPRVAGPAQL